MIKHENALSGERLNLKQRIGRIASRSVLVISGAAAFFTANVLIEDATNTGPRAVAESPLGAANGAEKAWCRWPSRWSLCAKAQELANEADIKASEVATSQNLQIHNGYADAFRHCYWSGRMTQEMGEETAKGFGDRHEYRDTQPDKERDMDLHNNAMGRTWASAGLNPYSRCFDGMYSGELVEIFGDE
jgi:hypothetical protein